MPAKTEAVPPAYSEYEDICYTPERRLLAAVLWRAIHDLLPERPTEITREDHIRDAYEWIFDRPDYGFMSFLDLCKHLDLDADVVRDEVRKMIGTQAPKRTHPTDLGNRRVMR
jgi:hypothetical protein